MKWEGIEKRVDADEVGSGDTPTAQGHTLHAFQSFQFHPTHIEYYQHLLSVPVPHFPINYVSTHASVLSLNVPTLKRSFSVSPVDILPLSLSLSLCSCRATMAKPTLTSLHFAFALFILHFFLLHASTSSDLEALMAFKETADAANKLTTWNVTVNPCSWYGVSCLQNRVSRLVLEGLDLQGSFQPLASLTQLRVLSLKRNRLSGPIPNLSNLTALKLLFLSYNEFSGEFPASVTSLFRLYRLDLSHNNLSGQIPETVNHLAHILTLRLEENRFSGGITGLNLPNLQDFNVSGNRLAGDIPKTLSAFPVSAFDRNAVLCGSPMSTCKNVAGDPTKPGSGGAIASPVIPGGNPAIVASSPSSIPISTTPIQPQNTRHGATGKVSPVAMIAIILGDILVLAIVSLLLYCYFWRNYAGKMRDGKSSQILEGEKIVYSSSPYPAQAGYERGRMVFFEGVKRFELEDLLRASAEMLGKGGFGTAYKAVLDDGNVVAVKRLKDAHVGGKREFEQHMEVLGRLRHPNVVNLRAYYFARDEKLLVYDYMPNGSLFWLLHGKLSPCLIPEPINQGFFLQLIWTFWFMRKKWQVGHLRREINEIGWWVGSHYGCFVPFPVINYTKRDSRKRHSILISDLGIGITVGCSDPALRIPFSCLYFLFVLFSTALTMSQMPCIIALPLVIASSYNLLRFSAMIYIYCQGL